MLHGIETINALAWSHGHADSRYLVAVGSGTNPRVIVWKEGTDGGTGMTAQRFSNDVDDEPAKGLSIEHIMQQPITNEGRTHEFKLTYLRLECADFSPPVSSPLMTWTRPGTHRSYASRFLLRSPTKYTDGDFRCQVGKGNRHGKGIRASLEYRRNGAHVVWEKPNTAGDSFQTLRIMLCEPSMARKGTSVSCLCRRTALTCRGI